jgi:FkbM family methyltransferase
MLKEICGHTFFEEKISSGGVIVDLGGNYGDFTRAMRKFFDARVYTVEPVPALFEALPEGEKIVKIKAAISDKNGEVEIFLPEDRCATVNKNAGGVSIIAREYKYSDLISDNKIAKIDLLKMDIECAEISLLKSLKKEDFEKIDQLTVEFHDFLYPELRNEVEELKKKIQNNGFYCISFSLTTNGDVLFIKKNRLSFGIYLFVKYLLRFWRGALRRIKKMLSIDQ